VVVNGGAFMVGMAVLVGGESLQEAAAGCKGEQYRATQVAVSWRGKAAGAGDPRCAAASKEKPCWTACVNLLQLLLVLLLPPALLPLLLVLLLLPLALRCRRYCFC
jgi:hypothetical protein